MDKLEFVAMGISVTKGQREWIEREARKRNQNISAIVREAIDFYAIEKGEMPKILEGENEDN